VCEDWNKESVVPHIFLFRLT